MLSIWVSHLVFRPVEIRLTDDSSAHSQARVGEWVVDTRPEPARDRFPVIDDDLVDAYPSKGERRFTLIDDELVRAYRNSAGERLRLYIGYHRSQRVGKELAGDAPRALWRGSLSASPRGRIPYDCAQSSPSRAGDRHAGNVLCIFLDGRVLDSAYVAKLYMMWDALTRRRTNGAVVMVEWGQPTGPDSEASRREKVAFVRQLVPLLPRYIPS